MPPELGPIQRNSDPAFEATQPLVECHSCGYQIPPVLGTTCPECGQAWTRSCELREVHRAAVINSFPRTLKAAGIIWFFILLMNAIGAGIAAMGDSFFAPLFVMLGIGFGVVMSLGVGIWICKLGPDHQFRLHAHCWIRPLWYLHAPWLSIAVFTTAGSINAIVFRFFDETMASSVLMISILLCFVGWAIVSLTGLVMFFSKYADLRTKLSIENAKVVVSLHVCYALLIWLGSVIVGFFGGMLGAIFMGIVFGVDPMNY